MTASVCRVCGRPLRAQKWAALRIGPTCHKRTHSRTAPHIPTPPPPDHIPGQAELPLTHHQPTLWSL